MKYPKISSDNVLTFTVLNLQRTNISKNITNLNVKMTLSTDTENNLCRSYLFLSYDKSDKSLKGLAGADHEIRKSKNQTNKYLLKKLLSSYQRSEL